MECKRADGKQIRIYKQKRRMNGRNKGMNCNAALFSLAVKVRN
jgi:hypothetical protein